MRWAAPRVRAWSALSVRASPSACAPRTSGMRAAFPFHHNSADASRFPPQGLVFAGKRGTIIQGPRACGPEVQSRRPMVERKLRPAPSTLHLLPSRKPVKTGGAAASKLFVLDTNVLLHDPTSLYRFEEHDIYLPLLTLEELDAHKKGMTEVARNARQASRFLDELVTAHAGPDT